MTEVHHAVAVVTRHPFGTADHGRVTVLRTAVEALSQFAQHVTVFYGRGDGPSIRGNVRFLPLDSRPSDLVHRLGASSLNTAAGISRSQIEQIKRQAPEVDFWYLDGVRCADLLPHVDGPVFVDLDDVLSLRYQRWADLNFADLPFSIYGTQPDHFINRLAGLGPRVMPLVLRTEAERVRRVEARIAESAHGVSLVNHAEARLFASTYQRFVHHLTMALPNTAPPGEVQPLGAAATTPVAADGYDIVFLGHVTHLTNLAGLGWFINDVLPKLQANQGGDLRIAVVGASTPTVDQWLGAAGCSPLGYVDDLGALLARCRVAVAPQVVAGGLNTKILDYAHFGLPIVGTPQAFGGFGEGHPWTGAHDADHFAAMMARFLDEPSAAPTGQAQTFVRNTFHPDVVTNQWVNAFLHTVRTYERQHEHV